MTPTIEDLQVQVSDLRDRLNKATGMNLAGEIAVQLGVENRTARLLALLLACPGVVSSELLWSEVFSDHATGDGPEIHNVKVHLSKARRRLRDLGGPESIVAVIGLGYRMMPDLRAWMNARLQVAA